MILTCLPDGSVRCLRTEAIDLKAIGTVTYRRASHVEPTSDGDRWTADLSPVDGPVLGPFDRYSDAIAAEVAYLEANVL